MNPGVFLVPAIHEIAVAAEFAVATEKPYAYALANRPTFDVGTKGIDPANQFMAGDSRPVDRKQAFYRGGIRVADPACLDANAYLIYTGIKKWFSYLREFSRFRNFDCSVCRVHIFSNFASLRSATLGRKLSQVVI